MLRTSMRLSFVITLICVPRRRWSRGTSTQSNLSLDARLSTFPLRSRFQSSTNSDPGSHARPTQLNSGRIQPTLIRRRPTCGWSPAEALSGHHQSVERAFRRPPLGCGLREALSPAWPEVGPSSLGLHRRAPAQASSAAVARRETRDKRSPHDPLLRLQRSMRGGSDFALRGWVRAGCSDGASLVCMQQQCHTSTL